MLIIQLVLAATWLAVTITIVALVLTALFIVLDARLAHHPGRQRLTPIEGSRPLGRGPFVATG